ncbi:hypothetical protein FM103_17845 [Corynebacterium xerosis]|nr:hypothetical protein FM103_17845 [Corynebacterium xerosis]
MWPIHPCVPCVCGADNARNARLDRGPTGAGVGSGVGPTGDRVSWCGG